MRPFRLAFLSFWTCPPDIRYCPTDPATRGQMAVFLTKTFGLP